MLREPADARIRGLVVHVPAFGEEMNKSRRMVAMTSRALAAAGHAVLVPDLFGCGDSAGEFGDASWEAWVDDVLAAVSWLGRAHDTSVPVWLWGHRAGALLACASLPSLPHATSLLLWSPVTSGAQHLAQFLRLAVTADALASGADRARTARLRTELGRGERVEIAGYALPPALAGGLESASFDVPAAFTGRVVWLEVDAVAEEGLSPAASATIERLRGRGVRVAARAVNGPRFWQAVEIQDCPALLQATCAMLPGGQDDDADVGRAAA